MTITKTFKDFFAEKFAPTRPFKKLFEMAIRHDIGKLPVNIDQDDVEFLQQFPHAFWKKAMQMRYDMLYDSIEKLHKDRRSIHKYEEIKDAILDAMNGGEDWSTLTGVIPDNILHHLKSASQELKNNEKIKEAEKLAHEYVKSKTPHVDEPKGEVPFTISSTDYDPESGKGIGSRNKQPTQTIMAKPFLNRLYHKLETTKGSDFHPESGLEGKGKFGYDMANPHPKGKYTRVNDEGDEEEVEVPHSTDGMRFPTETAIEARLTDFFNINMHRILGELPKDAVWLKTGFKDTWSAGYLEKELMKSIEAQLRIGGQYEDNKTLRADAAKMAKEQIIQMAKAGKLKGPPIPGKFPEGQTIEVTGPEGQERLVKPDLYLPYGMKPIKTKEPNGEVKTSNRMVPLVNPAHFFRELGSNKNDFTYDEDGKMKFDDNGKPIYSVPKEKLRGYQNQFVHVGDDEYVDDGRQKAAGALDFNHDAEGKMHITRGDPGYQEAFDKVFSDQIRGNIVRDRFVPSKDGGYYKDIIDGILDCYRNQGCGGSTGHERAILLQNIEDFHQIVVMKMTNNLRDPKLYTEEGRRTFANTKVSSIMQKDQERGGGTRRLRKLTQSARDASLDATTAGAEGGELSIADKISMGVQDKSKLGVGDGDGPTRLSGKRGKGVRKQNTGGMNTPYNLETMRETLVQLKRDAQQADAESEHAIQMSQRGTGEEIVTMLKKGINDRADVIYYITDLLVSLYKNSGNPQAKKFANDMIKDWVANGADSSEKLLAQFEAHPLVKQAVGMAQEGEPDNIQKFQPAERGEPQEDEKEALNQFNDLLQNMEDNGKSLQDVKSLLMPGPGEKYGSLIKSNMLRIAGFDKERIQDFLQKHINKLYGVADQPQVSATAAKDVNLAQKPDAEGQTVPEAKGPWTRFKAAQKWLHLAHHTGFLQSAPIQELDNVQNNITQMNSAGQLKPYEFQSAMKNIEQYKKQRGQ